ncbi:MAG: hypothetical protein RLZZ142_980 [Verrucomicrobiota bacterium]
MGEIREEGVGLVCAQRFEGEDAGGDGDRMGTDRLGTGDIVRGVAEDEDAVEVEGGLVEAVGALERDLGEGVAQVVVVGEGSKREEVGDLEVAQFDLGASFEVSGEQSEGDVGEGREGLEQVDDPGQERSAAGWEFAAEIAEVA